jgi:hypothetical protein
VLVLSDHVGSGLAATADGAVACLLLLFPLQGYSSPKGGKPTPLPVIFAVAMMADSKSCILVVVLWCCCDGDEASVGKKKHWTVCGQL